MQEVIIHKKKTPEKGHGDRAHSHLESPAWSLTQGSSYIESLLTAGSGPARLSTIPHGVITINLARYMPTHRLNWEIYFVVIKSDT